MCSPVRQPGPRPTPISRLSPARGGGSRRRAAARRCPAQGAEPGHRPGPSDTQRSSVLTASYLDREVRVGQRHHVGVAPVAVVDPGHGAEHPDRGRRHPGLLRGLPQRGGHLALVAVPGAADQPPAAALDGSSRPGAGAAPARPGRAAAPGGAVPAPVPGAAAAVHPAVAVARRHGATLRPDPDRAEQIRLPTGTERLLIG